MPAPALYGLGAVGTAIGGWFARRSITKIVLSGISSVWTFFKTSRWFQASVFTTVISDALGGLIEDTSEGSKGIVTIISWVVFAMILFFTLPAIVKYISKKLNL